MNLVLNEQSYIKICNFSPKVEIFPNFIPENQLLDYDYEPSTEIKDIFYIGRISKDKGSEVICKIALKMKNVNFHLVGPNEENFSSRLTNVIIHDSIPKNEVVEFIKKRADLLILPSIAEGFPMVYLDSMNSGVPIITNNVGAASIVFKNQFLKNYTIVNNNNIDEYIKKIQLLCNINIRKAVSRKNHENLIKNYTDTVCLKKLTEMYLDSLKNDIN
ncbi:glycosyltransferase family 4 protein [Massilimicrobiota sp. An142]|uniref:glycosyltransferase family 4 protein n=1 Tax=Massilimicrobiota sp. An142 TaxID=1965564 RepID=UPI0011810304|nr:glycosyltransferase family 4 protein [Massilimicrobiota sp. An142]